MTIYNRTFRFSASHFNSEQAYKTFWNVLDWWSGANPTRDAYLHALKDTHGHNFKVTIDVEGKVDINGWLIDDMKLEEIVMEWSNINISTHPDFSEDRERATTENMALKLKEKLLDAFPQPEHDFRFIVTVWETDDIYAKA